MVIFSHVCDCCRNLWLFDAQTCQHFGQATLQFACISEMNEQHWQSCFLYLSAEIHPALMWQSSPWLHTVWYKSQTRILLEPSSTLWHSVNIHSHGCLLMLSRAFLLEVDFLMCVFMKNKSLYEPYYCILSPKNKQTQRFNQQQQKELLRQSGKTCLHEHIQMTH